MIKKTVASAAIAATLLLGAASAPASATPPPSIPNAGTVSAAELAAPAAKMTPPTNVKASDLKPMKTYGAKSPQRLLPKGNPGMNGQKNLSAGNPAALVGTAAASKSSASLLSRTSCGGCYFYQGGRQTATSITGCSANVSVDWSYSDVESSDSGAHSLTECDIEKTRVGGGRDIVEVGITRDDLQFNPGSDGDDDPHLFVYYWINGVGQGYGTNFVRYTGSGSSPYGPGDSLAGIAGTIKNITISYGGSPLGWWIGFGGAWVGYYPANPAGTSTATNLWYPNTYTAGTGAQLFWEVWSNFNEPCTDMGNGYWGSSTFAPPWDYNWDPSIIGAVSLTGPASTSLTGLPAGPTVNYDMQFLSGTQMLGGGGGFTSTGADWGARNGC